MLSENYANNKNIEYIHYIFGQNCELYKMHLSYIINKSDDDENMEESDIPEESNITGESEENIL